MELKFLSLMLLVCFVGSFVHCQNDDYDDEEDQTRAEVEPEAEPEVEPEV